MSKKEGDFKNIPYKGGKIVLMPIRKFSVFVDSSPTDEPFTDGIIYPVLAISDDEDSTHFLLANDQKKLTWVHFQGTRFAHLNED